MSGEGEFENSLEYTPTWVMAGVCAVFFIISYAVVYFVNFLRDFVVEHQKPIYLALQVVIIGLFILFLF
jgi:mlo protein